MANEIFLPYPSGDNIYFTIRNNIGQVWYLAGEQLETWGESGRTADDYDISMTDKSGNMYLGNMDTDLPVGDYLLIFFIREGANPADTDYSPYSELGNWNGTTWLSTKKLAQGALEDTEDIQESVEEIKAVTDAIGSGAAQIYISTNEIESTSQEEITAESLNTAINNQFQSNEQIDTVTGAPSERVLQSIKGGLKWLSRQALWKCLYVTTELTALTEGSQNSVLPYNFMELDSIILNDGTSDGRPLVRFDGDFKKYLKYKEDENSSNYDEPRQYIERGNFIYYHRTSNGVYTPRIWYWMYHPVGNSNIYGDDANILFPGELESALEYAVFMNYMLSNQRAEKAEYYRLLAMNEVSENKKYLADKKMRKVRVRNI